MQLQDILYSQGFGTRRVCSGLIQQGLVQVYESNEALAPVLCAQSATDFVAEGLRFRVQGVDWPYQEKAYVMLNKPAGVVSTAEAAPRPWLTPSRPINTPFVSVPGLLTAECVSNEKGSYLAITVHGDPSDPRTDDITGDVVVNGQVQANWGLHLIDVNLAMGNLVDIVGQQSKAYLATHKNGK